VTTFVLDALLRFRRERPEVRFRISTMRGRARIVEVANGHIDLATVTSSESEIRTIARRTLHVERLREEPFVLVAGKSARSEWRQAFGALPDAPVSAETLAGFPLIMPERDAGIREFLDRDLEAAGMTDRLQVVMEIGGWSTILAYVRAGIGVGIVSKAACVNEKGLLPPRVLDPEQFRPIPVHLVCRRHVQGGDRLDLSEDAGRFRDHLIASSRG
jgi:DNA-binding transcriptional LysR family regulator